MGAQTTVNFGFELIDGRAEISTAISKHLMMTISVEACSAAVT
jgi:hypothetical protein